MTRARQLTDKAAFATRLTRGIVPGHRLRDRRPPGDRLPEQSNAHRQVKLGPGTISGEHLRWEAAEG